MNPVEVAMKNSLLVTFWCLVLTPTNAQEPIAATGEPQFESQFTHELLKHPTSVAVSPNGEFLYTAGYMEPTCFVLRHNRAGKSIELVDSITDPVRLNGTTSIRLNRDGRYAATASFKSGAVTLFRRDSDTGKLSILDSKSEIDPGVSGLGWAIEANFSRDGQFINVLDDTGGVTVFQIVAKDDAVHLNFVQALRSEDLQGARGLAIHPSADFLFVACKLSHSLVLLRQDPQTGKLEIVETARDEHDGVTGLYSAFGVSVCPRGKYVYTVSGLHGGGKDNAVCVFKFDVFAENKLQLVQEVFLRATELNGNFYRFTGGNEIRADRFRLFACGTASGSIAGFTRDPIKGKIQLSSMIQDRSRYRGIAGLAFSHDGAYLYAACEQVHSVCALKLPK